MYLGIIEGFFGKPWTWETRADYADFLHQHGFQFYIYAPKADQALRHQWKSPWPQETFKELSQLRHRYKQLHIDFGVGLSPYEAYKTVDSQTITDLKTKIEELNTLDLDILSIQFDDMKGDLPDLAEQQIKLCSIITEYSNAKRFIFCPTYYSTDPILDKVFGERPKGYFERLRSLDQKIDIYWTGPKVCSASYPIEHLEQTVELLQRRPFLWDNYPVNDGEKMCKHLHLDGFVGRPHEISQLCTGHAVNPMNQAYLSQIPLLTLKDIFLEKERYQQQESFQRACYRLLPQAFAAELIQDLSLLHYKGLTNIDASLSQHLIHKYGKFTTRFSQEIVDWLQGKYQFDPACLTETES